MCLHRDRTDTLPVCLSSLRISCISFLSSSVLCILLPSMLSYICSPFLLPFLSSIFSFLPKSFHSALLPLFHLSFYPLILFFPFIFPSFPPSFFPSSFPPSILCIIVWTQLCALHTFCFMWLQPHVLLLFGQCRDNQICVKCSFTLIGVSTQIGFQLPAQM